MSQFIVSVRIGNLGLNAHGEVDIATTYVPVVAQDAQRAQRAAVRWHGDNCEVVENDQRQWHVDDESRKVRFTAIKCLAVSDNELNEFLSVTQGLNPAIVVRDTFEQDDPQK